MRVWGFEGNVKGNIYDENVVFEGWQRKTRQLRTCVCERFEFRGQASEDGKKWKLSRFQFMSHRRKKKGFCVTTERLTEWKDETHSHHNFYFSRVLSAWVRRRILPPFHDNDSYTEIGGKGEFSCVPTLSKANTHSHTQAGMLFIERFTNIGKKYEIIKILDVWYWFLLIFHYEVGRRRSERRGWNFSVSFFFASAYIFRFDSAFFPVWNNPAGGWSERCFNCFFFLLLCS